MREGYKRLCLLKAYQNGLERYLMCYCRGHPEFFPISLDTASLANLSPNHFSYKKAQGLKMAIY